MNFQFLSFDFCSCIDLAGYLNITAAIHVSGQIGTKLSWKYKNIIHPDGETISLLNGSDLRYLPFWK